MVKTISFSREYEDEFEFLLKQQNPSAVACKAIRLYMQNAGKKIENNFEIKNDKTLGNLIKGLDPERSWKASFFIAKQSKKNNRLINIFKK